MTKQSDQLINQLIKASGVGQVRTLASATLLFVAVDAKRLKLSTYRRNANANKEPPKTTAMRKEGPGSEFVKWRLLPVMTISETQLTISAGPARSNCIADSVRAGRLHSTSASVHQCNIANEGRLVIQGRLSVLLELIVQRMQSTGCPALDVCSATMDWVFTLRAPLMVRMFQQLLSR